MFFKSLTINNLFSYYGACDFDFTKSSDENKNIVIIQGRNGHGKTSFLNSIKMLFTGISEDIRQTVQRKRTPSPKQYVCGIENELWGILNRQAREEGIYTCSIQACWESEEGEVKASREWHIDFKKNDYTETIRVNTPFQGELSEKHSAEAYLEKCLPNSYIPFFFFDGEEVQALAEANNGDVIKKMELLLNIKPLDNILETLQDISKKWKRGALNADNKRELTEKENQLRCKKTEIGILEQNLANDDSELSEIQSHINDITRKLRLLRGVTDQESEFNIKLQLQLQNEKLNLLQKEITESFQSDGFLRLTPALTNKTLKFTENLLKSAHGTQYELLQTLKQKMPDLLNEPPHSNPRLEPSQINFYQDKMVRLLDFYTTPNQDEAPFQLDSTRAKNLTRLLSTFLSSQKPHQVLQTKLQEIRLLNKTIQQLEQQLKDAGDLSQKHRLELTQLNQAEEKFKENLLDTRDRIRENANKKQVFETECTRLENEINHLDNKLRQDAEMERRLNFVKRLIAALNEVKQRLKKQKHAELEAAYDKHLKQLLDSNNLIAEVKINNNFEISYLDESGLNIGMSSVSAGMKQLSATALLWGLKEVSARELPIIIDTPLGRIDRQHQDNLLKKYYPNIGKQVILLPTDSELDVQKHALLQPYIYREYHLSNLSGKNTENKRIL